MTKEELLKYNSLFVDVWHLLKEHSEPVNDDAYWDELIDYADKLHAKHEKTEFAKKLILETLNEIERIYKENKNEKTSN